MLIQTFCGLFEIIFGLVNVTFSLPEWQAVKMTFFTPWVRDISEVKWLDSGSPFLRRNKPTLHVLLEAALDPTLSLVATNAAFQFWRKWRGCWEFNGMKYSSNLADYCSLKQSNVIGQVYIEQEHVFIKFQTVSSIFSDIESYSNAAFQFWRELRGCWESNWMKYSSNLAEYCSLSQSNVTGQVYVEQEHVFIIIPNSF